MSIGESDNILDALNAKRLTLLICSIPRDLISKSLTVDWHALANSDLEYDALKEIAQVARQIIQCPRIAKWRRALHPDGCPLACAFTVDSHPDSETVWRSFSHYTAHQLPSHFYVLRNCADL
jgi:hypothetical protein